MKRCSQRFPVLLRVAVSALTVVLAILAADPALATTFAPWRLEDFTANAHAAVTGTVAGIDVRWNDEHTQIHTYVSLDLDQVVIGGVLPAQLVLREPGGRVGNKVAVIPGAAVYRKGERVFVFVEKVDAIYRTLGYYQGKYVLENDPATGREIYVQRIPAGGVTVADAGGLREPEATAYARDELIQRVRAIAASH